MKKLLTVALALVTVLSMAVPAAAQEVAVGVGTSVTVANGGGDIPIVKVKWEQEPDDNFVPSIGTVTNNLESGDPDHSEPGTQVNPPLIKNSKKYIDYYAVVTDTESLGNVSQVFADVFHPMGVPNPYNNSTHTAIDGEPTQLSRYFKYEIPFVKLGHSEVEIDLVEDADEAGLMTYNSTFDLAEVIFELEKGTADLWKGTALIDYEQPAGMYTVRVYAVDSNNNLSVCLSNQFKYVNIAGVEVDFTSMNFGSVNLGVEKMIAGDTNFVSPAAPAGQGAANQATVRNIGNTWAFVSVKFDDMGFGQDINGQWNVQFDARMGNNQLYYQGNILPYTTRTLTNALGLSKKDELDLSIKVIKGFGSHSGTITIGAVEMPFQDPVPVPPAVPAVVGFAN